MKALPMRRLKTPFDIVFDMATISQSPWLSCRGTFFWELERLAIGAKVKLAPATSVTKNSGFTTVTFNWSHV